MLTFCHFSRELLSCDLWLLGKVFPSRRIEYNPRKEFWNSRSKSVLQQQFSFHPVQKKIASSSCDCRFVKSDRRASIALKHRRVTSGVTSNFHREDEIHPTTLWHFGNSNKLKDRRSRREENFRSPRFPGVSLSLVVFRSKTKVRQRSRANTRTINFTVKRQFQTRCNRDRTRVAVVRDLFYTFYVLQFMLLRDKILCNPK